MWNLCIMCRFFVSLLECIVKVHDNKNQALCLMLHDIRNSLLLYQAADLNKILSERGACGVGFVANLRNEPSFNIVRDAITALGCMEHRGGCGADNDSGDGSGLMTGIPWDLFDDWANKQGLAPFDRTNTGVGMVFLPKDEKSMAAAKAGNILMLHHNMFPSLFLVLSAAL
jgi:hypothetical protein